MRFTNTPLIDAVVVDIDKHVDERGFFARVWCTNELSARGLSTRFTQCNSSFSEKRGTLRGLHYQRAPYREAKLIRCIRGAVFDVVVDLRHHSPTFRKWFGLELTADNRRMLYVPEGCAHGLLTLEDQSEVMYPVSENYEPEAEWGIRWDDPAFVIRWPEVGTLRISEKDQAWPDFVS